MTEVLLTLEDVAEALKVSVDTVRRIIADGEIKTIRVRRQLRIRESELEGYLRRQSN